MLTDGYVYHFSVGFFLAQTVPFIKPINWSCFSVLNASFRPNYQLTFRPVSRHDSFFCKLQTEDKS